MVSPYTPNLHSSTVVQVSGNDLDWDTLYGLPRSVHARGLLLAPAVATASLSAQGWATLMAGPFWGCDDCSQSYGSLDNLPWGQVGVPVQGEAPCSIPTAASSPVGNEAYTHQPTDINLNC